MSIATGWAATAPGAPLQATRVDLGPLGAEEVEVEVEYCGICHSDLSMINDEWHGAHYPFIPGHEVIGRVAALGSASKGLEPGQRVGIGWNAGSCMHCRHCLGGDQHLCGAVQATIVGHHGGFADRVRAHWAWTIPLPDGLDPVSAGPLLCGGITVFKPLIEHHVPPTARIGVVGIGGLGHMALGFARAWGAEVTAFTSTPAKTEQALAMGAHRVVASRDRTALKAIAGSLNLLIITVNATLDWAALISTLAAKGRLHVVGVLPEPLALKSGALIGPQRQVSGSPTGSPVDIATMLDFAARHTIRPQVEVFPLAEVNAALARLAAGEMRYRGVLKVA